MPPLDLIATPDWQVLAAADQRAAIVDTPQGAAQFIVTMYDPDGRAMGEIGDYVSTVVTPKRNAVSPGTIVLKGDDEFGVYADRCWYTTVPVTIETANGWVWSGRVDTCTEDTVAGVATWTLQLIGDWNWFNKLIVFPAFWMPIEAQIPKEAVFVGPAKTNILEMVAECCIRQSGLIGGFLQLLNNALNPAAWLGSVLDFTQELPIVVVPTNPLTDTSKWTAITCKMTTVAAAVEQTLKDCGLTLTADLWRPGDPQPAPGWMTLTKTCIVVDVKDYSTATGLTGTMLDGLIGEGVDLIDTVLGEILTLVGGADISDADNTNATAQPYGDGIIAHLLGVDAKPSWVVYEDGPDSGISESHITAHHPLAYRVITGGKSPDWVNKGIDLMLEWMLSELLAVLGASGIASTLLDGLLDNVFLAYQQIEDEPRRIKLGRFGYPDYFAQGGSSAYTLNAFIVLESALWDTRGYHSFTFTTQDGYPYSFGGERFGVQHGDYGIGFPVTMIRRNRLYTDYCSEATLTDDRTSRVKILAKVGDQSAVESPYARFARRISSIYDVIKAASLAQN